MKASPVSVLGGDRELERAEAGKSDLHAGVVADDLDEGGVAVRAAQHAARALEEEHGPDRARGAATAAGADRGRQVAAEDLLQQTGDRVAVQHQRVHLTLRSVRTARS